MHHLIALIRWTLGLGVVLGATLAVTFVWSAAPSPGPLFSDADAMTFRITLDSGPFSASAITRNEAIAAGAALLRPTAGIVAEVHHGRAAVYEDSPEHSVWVVVYPGGRAPSYGPPGNDPGVTLYHGAIIDDLTGEFLRGLMMTRPAN